MFSNIGSDANIDWATLAQQWIQRNTNNETMEAPPPPDIGYRTKNYGFDEQGEADMDMDDDEQPPPPPPMAPITLGNDNMMQYPLHNTIARIDADPTTSWTAWMNPPHPSLSQQFPKANPTAHIPSLLKISVPNPNDVSKIDENAVENTCTTIDAAKRKVLPAWIREGLEKMEREKQRQLERQQQLKERNNEKPTTASLALVSDNTVKDHVNVVESLECGGDSSGNEEEEDDDHDLPYKLKNIKTNKTKQIGNNEVTTGANSGASNDDDDTAAPALYVGKSYEQRLADLMIMVRRNLTELLLEVTNDEIAQIAKETLNSSKLKGLAAYSSSGDESDSDNSAISDREVFRDNHRRRSGTNTNTAADDSEEEIRARLRARRRAFAKTTEEIEDWIAKNNSREEQKLRYYKQKELPHYPANDSEDEHKDVSPVVSTSTFGGIGKNNNSRDFGETTTESKLQQSNGKKSKDRGSRRGERTTRFSDNKDSKTAVTATAAYITQLNSHSTASAATVAPITSSKLHGFQLASPNSSTSLTDINTNTHNLYTPTTATAATAAMLSAAEAALEKASKSKSSKTSSRSVNSSSNDKRRKEREDSRRHSSDDSDSSSTTTNSTDSTSSSDTSRGSKYSRTSYNSTSRHKRSRNRSSSGRYRSDRSVDERRSHHNRRDYYDGRGKSYRSSSSKYSTHRHERSRDRSRSRSRSTYSSSSSKRRHNRH